MIGGRAPGPGGHDLSVILDADGVTKAAGGDRRVRLMLLRLLDERNAVLVVPLIGVVQALARGSGERAIERLIQASLDAPGLDVVRVRTAAHLLRDASTTDVADAVVCGEALLRVPSVLITSDPTDMRRLLAADPRGPRVAVWGV